MENLQKNIVPSTNQNSKDFFRYENTNSGNKKILFVGNSITKHEPKSEIGWTNDCGMAASSADKDYVHLLMNKVNEKFPNSSFAILQVANFERNFSNVKIEEMYQEAKEFNADIIIMFFGANVNIEYDITENPPKTFGCAYEELRNYLNNSKNPIFAHSQGFYIRPKLDNEKQIIAQKYNDIFITIEDIRNRKETHGKFNHPSDLGMKEIANRFWDCIKDKI